MECVVVENTFDPPIVPDAFPDLVKPDSWCFDLHRASHRRAHVAIDGSRTACVFLAPDAESVRIALRQIGNARAVVWSATVHDPPVASVDSDPLRGGAVVNVVERSFAEPVTVPDIQALEDHSSWCLETHQVRFLRTYAARDGRRMLCLYAAPDAEAVRAAQRQAAMPFDRVWSALLLLEPDEQARS